MFNLVTITKKTSPCCRKIYPDNEVIMVMIGVFKGNGSGFIKPVTRCVTPLFCTSWFVLLLLLRGELNGILGLCALLLSRLIKLSSLFDSSLIP